MEIITRDWQNSFRRAKPGSVSILTRIIISIPDEELFSETAVGCTASCFVGIMWCIRWFCNPPPPPLLWGCEWLYLRSPKGSCCSISDDLSCSVQVRTLTFLRPELAYTFDWSYPSLADVIRYFYIQYHFTTIYIYAIVLLPLCCS